MTHDPTWDDDTSSWHSAFDPPQTSGPSSSHVISSPLTTSKHRRRSKKKSSKSKKSRRKTMDKKCKKSSKSLKSRHKTAKKKKSSSSAESRPFSSSCETAPDSNEIFEDTAVPEPLREREQPPSRTRACAKMLVRSSLRCPCHFIYRWECPLVQFAPVADSSSHNNS